MGVYTMKVDVEPESKSDRQRLRMIRERFGVDVDELEELLAEQVSVMAVDVRPIRSTGERLEDKAEKSTVPVA